MPFHSIRPLFALVLIGGATALSSGEALSLNPRANDAKMLRKLDAAWSASANKKDLAATVSYYTEDATFMMPAAPMLIGKQEIKPAWKQFLDSVTTVTWSVIKVDVAKAGDTAYLIGRYQCKFKGVKGAAANDRGKFLEVWKRQKDGKWKCVADMFNSDLS